MKAAKKKSREAAPRARSGRLRQRQRLIDACISALHLYGPSRTTVEKVVAIAKMSPGIVRFYFDSKAALLVASLQFLATEFEDRVLAPVTALEATPIDALQLMVELFFDPDIASPRKVSVWYAFWGEASSRQEYYDICGQKDERFAALVRTLIGTLIVHTRQSHLDPDGIALGLIGVLEILWQDIAFQTERDIDRPAAKRRCRAYLRSVFPGCFESPGARGTAAAPAPRVAGWAYGDARIAALERQALFRTAWFFVGHEAQIARAGDFTTFENDVERVLVVRDAGGAVQVLRNSCPATPHALVAASGGRFEQWIECAAHGLKFHTDGRFAGAGLTRLERPNLRRLAVQSRGGLLFARAEPASAGGVSALLALEPPANVIRLDPPRLVAVAANWKVIVERWLESVPAAAASVTFEGLAWDVASAVQGWSATRYGTLLQGLPGTPWRRHFVMPNQLIETRPDGVSVIEALPASAGRCWVRRTDYTALPPDDAARAAMYLAARVGGLTRRATVAWVESLQRGLVAFEYGAGDARSIAPAVAEFRALLAERVPALRLPQAPTDS